MSRTLVLALAGTISLVLPVSSVLATDVFDTEGMVVDRGRILSMAACDFDRDGILDLLVSDYIAGVVILQGTGGLTFANPWSVDVPATPRTSAHDAAAADLNADGLADLFLVYNRFPSRVLFATGADAFVDSGQEVGSLALSGTSVVLADVDGDADRDAFVAYYQAPARLYVNDGSGRFVYSGQQFGDNCFCVAAGDLDSDGDPDLACRLIDDGVLVWMNEDGVYSLSQTLPKGGWGQLLLLDADGDGDLELLVTSNVTGSEIWTNDGAGGLTRSPDALDSATVAACADVDGDGDPDLALDAAVWLNNGAGRFAKAQEFSAQTVTTVALIDLDSDGRPDLLVGGIDLETGNGPLTIYRNRGG